MICVPLQVAKFFLNKESFLWDSTNLLSVAASGNSYLMLDPFVNDGPFELSNFSFSLQDLHFVRLSIKDPHCLVRPCSTCVKTISCFLWLTVFSPRATSFRNIRTPRKQVETIVVGLSDLSPSFARSVPSRAHYIQAPAKQAKLSRQDPSRNFMSGAKEKSGSALLRAPTILKALIRTFWTTNDYLLVTYTSEQDKKSEK